MSKLKWDQVGERLYETGVDRGVLYPREDGEYEQGFAWNGLTAVTESPSGAEPTPWYADNIKYLNVLSREDFNATLEAMTCPREFYPCDGTAVVGGVLIGQQNRQTFGLSYRTLIGNDEKTTDFGYKIHLVWGALAAPSERAYATVNESPEATSLSWELSTTQVEVGEVNGVFYKPTSLLTIPSTDVDPDALKALEDILYGTSGEDPRLPSPSEVLGMFDQNLQVATSQTPAYNSTTRVVTIPNTTGVDYSVDGEKVTGTYTVPNGVTKVVKARPAKGYKFADDTDNDWQYPPAA